MSRSSPVLEFSVISDSGEFESLRSAWNDLDARLGNPHLFARFDWWLNAWQLYARRRDFGLYLVTGWLGGQLVLAWPLMTENRVLRMLSSGTLEYRDIIVPPSEHAAAWVDQAWSFVRSSSKADVYILQNLRRPNALAQKLSKVRGARPIGGGWCPVIQLNRFADWDAYASTLSKSLVADQRRQWKRVRQAMPGLSFEVIDRADLIPVVMEWIARHKIAWGEARQKGAVWFVDPDIREVLRRAAVTAFQEERFVLSVLRDGDTLLSAGWGYHCGDEFLFHAFAYDPAYATYSPSRLLLECLVRYCFDRGVRSFDFMPGQEPYKGTWATDYIRTDSYIGELSWRGALLLGIARLRPVGKSVPRSVRRIYAVLPEPGRELVKRAIRTYRTVYEALSLKLPPPAGTADASVADQKNP